MTDQQLQDLAIDPTSPASDAEAIVESTAEAIETAVPEPPTPEAETLETPLVEPEPAEAEPMAAAMPEEAAMPAEAAQPEELA